MEVTQLLNKVRVLQKATEEAKRLYRDRFAPDFTVFDFIEPNEMRLSRILAWFLDPEGTHGQGGRFLHLLLERVAAEWPPDVCEHANVGTETSVEEGRIDIIVRSASGTLVIENKPWAADQSEQIRRYFTHLDRMKAARSILIYLTVEGTVPSSVSICETERQHRIETSQLYCWSYREHILGWLAECRAVCRADRVSIFINEFAQYIRKHFEGIGDMTMQNQLVEVVTRSAETLSPTIEIILAKDAIFTKLISNLNADLSAKAMNEGWVIDGRMTAYKESYLKVDLSSKSCCAFGIGFEHRNFRGFGYGLTKKDIGQLGDGGARAAIVHEIGDGPGIDTDKYWPWWRNGRTTDTIMPFEADWSLTATPWVAIADGRMAETIIGAVCRFRDALSRHGLT